MPWRDVIRADNGKIVGTDPKIEFHNSGITDYYHMGHLTADGSSAKFTFYMNVAGVDSEIWEVNQFANLRMLAYMFMDAPFFLQQTGSVPGYTQDGVMYYDISVTPSAYRIWVNGAGRRIAYASSTTTPTGTWAVGDIIYHTDAAPGGYAGRVCTTAPSTFTPFGVLGAGYMPFAYPIGGGSTQTTTTANNLAASGGTVAVPMDLEGPMQLDSVSFWNTDAATARGPVEFALYRDATNATNSLPLVTGAVGTLSSWTPTVASLRTINVTSPPVLLTRGAYWLVIKNNNAAAQTLGVGVTAAGTMAQNVAQTKTLSTSAFGSTLDLVAATWTKINTLPGVRLNGRSFGQSTAF